MAEKPSKVFERKVHEYLKEAVSSRDVMVHRFPDTLSARGAFLPAQPGDFMLLWEGSTLLIETKTSAKFASLKDGLMKLIEPQQIGAHILWMRAGHPALFLFESSVISVKRYEVWRSESLVECVRGRKDVQPLAVFESRLRMLQDTFGSQERLDETGQLCRATRNHAAFPA